MLPFEKGETNYFGTRQIDGKSFILAVTNAQLVIDGFAGAAMVQQQTLERDNVPLPPTGAVPAEQRNPIFARGVVNDVGTCYFINGRSLEYLGQIAQAMVAYQAATNYPYARTWDPRGQIFWSPAEAAAGRLLQMPKQ